MNDAYKNIISKIDPTKRMIISIDGPCGSGKTTLAGKISKTIPINVVHMDDFYLPFYKRDKNWMNIVAGHMDYDRLIKNVLIPYKENKKTNYVSYDCHSDKYMQEIEIDLSKLVLLEGSYSSNPLLDEYVDFRIYVDIDSDTQIERLTKRNEKLVDKFISMWIPFENNYFLSCNIREISDMVVRG